jgi:hypothetical protein
MEFYDFPRTGPNAFAAVCAALIDYRNPGFQEFNRVFWTDANAASAEIAFPRNNVDHQWRIALHASPSLK